MYAFCIMYYLEVYILPPFSSIYKWWSLMYVSEKNVNQSFEIYIYLYSLASLTI